MSNVEYVELIEVENASRNVVVPISAPTVVQVPRNMKFDVGNMKGAYWWAGFYFKMGYWNAATPYKWNEFTKRAELVTSNWRAVLRTFNLLVVITSSILQILGIGIEIYHGTLRISDMSTIYLFGAIFMTGYTVVFQIHTVVRPYEVLEFCNHGMDYLRFVDADGCFKNPKKLDRWMAAAMGLIGAMCGTPIVFAVCAYLFRCDFHLHSKLLPTCDYETGNPKHRSGPWMLFYSFVLFYCTNQNVSSALCYISMILLSTVGCRVILDSMMKDVENADGSSGKFRSPERWITHYRCLRMVFNRMNIAIGKFIIPFFLTIILVLVVTMNYGILVLDFTVVMAYGIVLVITFMTGASLAMFEGAMFAEITEYVIQTHKGNCVSKRIWFAKVLRYCQPLAVDVSGYFTIDKTTFLEYLSQVVDYTIEAVLSFPPEDLDEALS